MNCFDHAIQRLGLTGTSQGPGSEYSWAFALLTMCSQYESAHPTADVLPDPLAEVLRRLGTLQSTFAGQRLAQMFARFPR